MSHNRNVKANIVVLCLVFACITACTPIVTPTPDFPETETKPIARTDTPKPTNTRKVYPKKPTDMPSLPFSEPGPYHVGIRREIIFVDASRNNREVNLVIWYPAIKNMDSDSLPTTDAIADVSAAPYPVIMSASRDGSIFGNLLASYGFVYIGINRLFPYDHFGKETFDQPLDFIFAINQVSNSIISGLDGVINTQIIGTMGYSFDGINSLLLSGARIDPEYYFAYCQQAPSQQPPLEDWYLDLYCEQSGNWDKLSVYLGEEITDSMDGLWQPFNDERIKAVMPMAVDGAWLIGEKGLAAADRPALMIQASNDSQYQPTEAAFIFENYGSKDKAMISFLNQSHSMIYNPVQIAKMSHFAVAFFSHQLQGKEDMAYYYSQEFIEQDDDLKFGFYSGE